MIWFVFGLLGGIVIGFLIAVLFSQPWEKHD